jgi:hypothetical protein
MGRLNALYKALHPEEKATHRRRGKAATKKAQETGLGLGGTVSSFGLNAVQIASRQQSSKVEAALEQELFGDDEEMQLL